MGMSCRSHDEELLLHSGKIKPSLSSNEGFVVVRDGDQSTPHRRRQHQHRRIAAQTTAATTTGSSTGHVDQLQHQHQEKHQGIRATEDAPHCMTCYCLSNKMKCTYRRATCTGAAAAATADLERCTELENLSLEALNYNRGDYPDCSSKLTVEGSESNTDRQKPSSTRKRLVEELLREMQLNSLELDDDQLTRTSCAGGDLIDGQWNCGKNQDEETGRTSGSRQPRQQQRRPRRRPSGTGSYCSISTVRHKPKAAETSDLSATANEMTTYSPIRSCERFPVEERKCDTYDKDKPFGPSGITVPEIEDIGTDNTVDNKASRDPASSPYRLSHTTDKWQQPQQQQQQQRRSNGNSSRKNSTSEAAQALHDLDVLHVPGRNNGQGDNTADRLTLPDKDESDESDGGFTRRSRSHVRELKLVRWEFIERIYDEVRRLHRLQRHLDDCSPRRCVTHTKSVSTMTSGRGIRGDTDTSMLGDDALRGN